VNATANPILELRTELRSAAFRRITANRRRRRLIVFAVIVVTGAATGLSIAANGWLTGEPAPAPVVSDFKAYTPQLGFHPDPGKAVFVAQDGAIKLYATTNREGTYCLVVDEPWKPPSANDGGTCVPKTFVGPPLTAGVIGGAPGTWVVAGRVVDRDARTILFSGPDGTPIERTIGSSGFYVAAVKSGDPFCPARDWSPTFVAYSADGRRLLESKIWLVRTAPEKHLCWTSGTPHG
jgi:hypothetical protein